MGNLIVGIDIGTTKVCTVIGRINEDSQLDVIGRGMAACSGIKKGVIVDIDSTAESIKNSVAEAEAAANMKVASAYVNIHGMHVSVINNRSWISISNEDREITQRDIDAVISAARDIDIPEDRQLIDVIARQYIVDGYDEIIDPVGMVGTKLEVDADIVVGKITSVQNIVKSVERAGIQLDGIIVEAFATGEVCLTPDERDMGVILLDVGGNITDISVFQGKRLIFYDSIPIGGDHITNDISIGLRISPREAEKIKRQFELALTSLIKNDQNISVFDISENCKKDVKVSEVVEIMEARVYEIFSLCRSQLEKAGVKTDPAGGIVLTGAGISYVDGSRQLAQEVFNNQVRVVQAGQIQGVMKPEFISSSGMIRYIDYYKKRGSRASEMKLKKAAAANEKETFFGKLIRILKEIF